MHPVRIIATLSSAVRPLLSHTTAIRALSTGDSISGGSMGRAWADKEHAAEAQYFNKKDAELLAKLAQKLSNHTAPTEDSIKANRDAVAALLAKHSVSASDGLIDDIIKFKFHH